MPSDAKLLLFKFSPVLTGVMRFIIKIHTNEEGMSQAMADHLYELCDHIDEAAVKGAKSRPRRLRQREQRYAFTGFAITLPSSGGKLFISPPTTKLPVFTPTKVESLLSPTRNASSPLFYNVSGNLVHWRLPVIPNPTKPYKLRSAHSTCTVRAPIPGLAAIAQTDTSPRRQYTPLPDYLFFSKSSTLTAPVALAGQELAFGYYREVNTPSLTFIIAVVVAVVGIVVFVLSLTRLSQSRQLRSGGFVTGPSSKPLIVSNVSADTTNTPLEIEMVQPANVAASFPLDVDFGVAVEQVNSRCLK